MSATKINSENINLRQQLEKALLYIDQHLEEKMSVVQIANFAGMSSFHFHHVFNAFLGETLDHYVLQRRLELAAKKLVHHKKIEMAEIATSSGFESHREFSKAFKKRFKITPSVYRNYPHLVNLSDGGTPSHSKSISRKGKTIEVMVKALPTLWLNHKHTNGTTDGLESKENYLQITKEFKTLLNTANPHLFCLATSSPPAYTITTRSLEESLTTQLYGGIYNEKYDNDWSDDWLEVDEGLWAVCTHKGDYRYTDETWSKFLRTWLPESGYELRDTIHFGQYLNVSEEVDKNDVSLKHIYLPIKKASTEPQYI